MNTYNELEEVIRRWIIEVDRSRDMHHDLHLDAISEKFALRSEWGAAALECLKIAVNVLRAVEAPFGISIGFRLHDTRVPTGFSIGNPRDLQADLHEDQSPSLYLLLDDRVIPIDTRILVVSAGDILGWDIAGAVVTFGEWPDEDGGYARFLSIWVPASAMSVQ